MAPGAAVTIAFGVGGPEPQDPEPPSRPGAAAAPRPSDGMISFEADGRRLIARLIAGEFIKYQSRFPATFGCRAEVAAAPFIEAVRRVSLVAERASPVRLAFGSGQVVIEAQAEGRARAVETMPADFDGDEPVISFNPHSLLDGLVAAAAADPGRRGASETETETGEPQADPGRIRLEFTSPAKPALVTWAGDTAGTAGGDGAEGTASPAFRYLLVPLRVPARA
jgi:DNA polymerase-3 subunit beta